MISSEEDLIEVLDANGNLFFFNPHPERRKIDPGIPDSFLKRFLAAIFNR